MGNDSVTVTSRQSWFSRIVSAFAGVIIGLILFFAAFPLLAWNEGRAIKREKTLQEGAKTVVDVPASPVDATNDGKLVHVTGTVTASGPASDPTFGISAEAIKLQRGVEMYQWNEEQKSETKKQVGGSEETVTTYSYDRRWSSTLIDSQNFHTRDGHQNPSEMPVESETFVADDVTVGAFDLSDSLIDRLDDYTALPVTEAELKKYSGEYAGSIHLSNGKFYIGNNPKEPVIGDVRVGYEMVKSGPVSIVAAQAGQTFEAYTVKNLGSIELLQEGVVSAKEMFAAEQQANVVITWLLRLCGFLMMLFGLLLIVKPLSVLADVLPFLGGLVGFGTGILSLLLALPLTLVTIALAWLAYRPLIGIPLFIGAIVSIVLAIRSLRKKTALKVA